MADPKGYSDDPAFPRPTWAGFIVFFGLVVTATAILLSIDVVYEQTLLTWHRGPQMVGFVLIHSLSGGFLVLSFYAGMVWLLLAAAYLAWRRRKKRLLLSCAAIYLLSAAIMAVPYGWWQVQTIRWWGPSPEACKYMQYGEANWRPALAKALKEKGYAGPCLPAE